MAKCPKCGGEVAYPRKSWKMAGRPDRTGKGTELTIGLFDCPSCKKPFRVVLSKRKFAYMPPKPRPAPYMPPKPRPKKKQKEEEDKK